MLESGKVNNIALENTKSLEQKHQPEYKITPEHWRFIRPYRAIEQFTEAFRMGKIPSFDPTELSGDAYQLAQKLQCTIKFCRLARLDPERQIIEIGHRANPERALQHNIVIPDLGRGLKLEFDDIRAATSVRGMIFDSTSSAEITFIKNNLALCLDILRTSGRSYQFPVKIVIIQGETQIY